MYNREGSMQDIMFPKHIKENRKNRAEKDPGLSRSINQEHLGSAANWNFMIEIQSSWISFYRYK
jgi:hypothetical protein